MALTFTREPDKFSPAYNDLTYICTSDNDTEDNFKVKVVIKDKDAATLATQLIPLRPDSTLMIDPKTVIQSQVSSQQILDFLAVTAAQGWQQDTNTLQLCTVHFQEFYGSPPVVSGTTYQKDCYAYNGSLRYNEFIDYAEADFLLVLNNTKRVLTAQPTTRNIREDESAQITVISDGNSGANTIASLQIKTYTGTTLTQTATITNSNNPYGDDDNKCLRILVGTRDLLLSTLATGSQPLITATITSYTIQVLDGNGATSSELITFEIDRDCGKYEATRLHFLNRLGGMDSFTFKMKRKLSETIKRDSFKRLGYMYGATYSNNITERGRVIYDTTTTEQYQVFSDWITEDESEWLRDLYDSPEVYWERSDSEIVAINVQERDYKVKTRVNDRLFNVDLSFELATDNIRQKG